MNRQSLIAFGGVPMLAVLVAGLVAFSAVPSRGHHASYFDRETTLSITGTVASLEWTNPHAFLLIDVAAEDGHVDRWTVEGRSPNQLIRNGWNRTSIQPGETITVTGRPPRELTNLADGIGVRFFLGAGPVTLPDGSTMMFGGQVQAP